MVIDHDNHIPTLCADYGGRDPDKPLRNTTTQTNMGTRLSDERILEQAAAGVARIGGLEERASG